MTRSASSAPRATSGVLFDEIRWRDPISAAPLEPIVSARTPAGVPVCGALRVPGTRYGYPIVDCVARLTPELASRHREWLAPLGLEPPPAADAVTFQAEATVESFGFQWSWNSAMRSEADLEWRVARRFRVEPGAFAGQVVLDAGAGAGDQSRWLVDRGARVVSVDLSSAIEVVSRKLRLCPAWVGVQGDLTRLPFADGEFSMIYCEGVIQHTRDSGLTVREFARALAGGGTLLATHYARPGRWLGRVKLAYMQALRARLSRWDRYRLLLLTGNLATLTYVPLLGRLLARSGTVSYSALMPDFKTTWTNTFDTYGNHAYQRYIEPEAFWRLFEEAGLERLYTDGTVVVARMGGGARALSSEPPCADEGTTAR